MRLRSKTLDFLFAAAAEVWTRLKPQHSSHHLAAPKKIALPTLKAESILIGKAWNREPSLSVVRVMRQFTVNPASENIDNNETLTRGPWIGNLELLHAEIHILQLQTFFCLFASSPSKRRIWLSQNFWLKIYWFPMKAGHHRVNPWLPQTAKKSYAKYQRFGQNCKFPIKSRKSH